ncbi:MAG: response regulator GlrR [Desulfobulbaceae bacterium BRH_c16a]|nr:MAG: response regulator GlrR [Desulfobulbaceae bacterium BRH_c16a]
MKQTDFNAKTILAIDDDASILRVIGMRLKANGYCVLSASDSRKAIDLAEQNYIDLAVIDYKLNDDNGVDLMEKLRDLQPLLPAIILTAYGTIGSAVNAMERGACNYLTKPFDGDELIRQIENCLEKSRMLNGRYPPDEQHNHPAFFSRIIARSREMKSVLAKVVQVAVTDSNVYIEGESGTGKELIARCLHAASPRKNGPFIAINCAAIPENLLESELLGYEKGAFTGADGRREGLFARAHGGSFFFDELSELPLSMQAKLLRILEEREFYPLGSNRKVKVDVRIIAASNSNLDKLMHDRLFREDLYYRIHVIPIVLPPLRRRKEDILPLARHFLAGFSKEAKKNLRDISPDALRKLMAYDWPGNVRELENSMEYAVAMAEGEIITPDLIACMSGEESIQPLRHARDNFEKEYLTQLLELNQGNVSQAAKAAGKYRADFYALLRKHGLNPTEFREK